MSFNIENEPIDKFIMIGDKVLIKPKNPQSQTKSGLYLPPSVQENERIQSGYVIKVGPGIAIPGNMNEDEPWKKKSDEVRYIPLQARIGDLAVFQQSAACEITFNDELFLIVPHGAIFMLIRDPELFD